MPVRSDVHGHAGAGNGAGHGAATRVLLVEDDEIVRPLLVTWLAETGIDVTSAESGASAIRLIEDDDGFDILITDLRMPGLDGVAVGECWRRHFPDRPVIYATGFVQDLFPGSVVREHTALLAKPFRFSALLDLVLRLTSGATVVMGAFERATLSRRLAGALS